MRTFKVNVNGTSYEVAVEEIAANASAPAAPAAPVAAQPAAAQPAAAPAPASAPAGGKKVCAPMLGTILSVNVQVGDTVKPGTVLMVLEAMKMENEILCEFDGTVASVAVAKGSAVEAGTLLCTIG